MLITLLRYFHHRDKPSEAQETLLPASLQTAKDVMYFEERITGVFLKDLFLMAAQPTTNTHTKNIYLAQTHVWIAPQMRHQLRSLLSLAFKLRAD